jgi:uncharacterized membrane protein
MVTYRKDITVERPAADVFPYLADISQFPQWMGGTHTEPISSGPMRAGYRYRYQTDEGLMELEVTGFQPGRSVTAHTVSGPMRWEGTFEVFDDVPGQSRVVSSGEIRMKGARRLLEPFIGGEIRKAEQRELERLKELAERAGNADAGRT